MRVLLALTMLTLLMRAGETMDAASAACRLFVTAVLPGLFPYMVLSLMLASRFGGRVPPWLLTLLGWGGGSPTGARLLSLAGGPSRRQRVRLAVTTATMSPMFLLGTCGGWLGSGSAGAVLLVSVIAGGWLTGVAAGACTREGPAAAAGQAAQGTGPLAFGAAVEQTARTMLLVCGTMVMLRVLAVHAAALLPIAALPVTTVMEVTTGVQVIAGLPWPLPLRTAAIAGATGFGGMAIILQNRAVSGEGLIPLPAQLLWQAVHGVLSFLLALGMMQLIP